MSPVTLQSPWYLLVYSAKIHINGLPYFNLKKILYFDIT